MTVQIPLFPLNTVLFPGGKLDLRIFEPRYLSMVSRCLQAQAPFGVVAIKDGSEVGPAETYALGTLAEIVEWRREPDGLLGLTAAGRGLFEVEHVERAADGLYVARVRERAAEAAGRPPPEHAALVDLLRQVRARARARGADEAYDDASWVSYRLAEALPLPIARRQALLEAPDAAARLRELARILQAPPRAD